MAIVHKPYVKVVSEAKYAVISMYGFSLDGACQLFDELEDALEYAKEAAKRGDPQYVAKLTHHTANTVEMRTVV